MEQQSISSDLIRGHIDTIILHTLLDGDKFAEQISETIEKKSQNAYKINQATLYSALKRLQNVKLLNAYQRDIDNGGRRKFFALTDKGRETVEQNLSSWSYSRAIIDKLIDCEPQPIYKTEYVEKIVQIPVEKVVYKDVYVEEKKQEVSPINTSAKTDIDTEITSQNVQHVKQENVQETNFRNIINGLIKTCNISNEKNDEAIEISAIKRDDVVKSENVQNFNETITENARPSKRQELETIDFSDLILKASQEGYKLRVSNKNLSVGNGNLLINRLNLFTSLSMFLLILIELLVLSLTCGKLLDMGLTFTLGLIVAVAIYPIICIIKYVKNQFLTISKNVSKDIILTSAIIIFNLLLVNFAGILIFGLDFSVQKDVLLFLIIPMICYIDILIYSILRFIFGCHKLCNITKK